jgi:hypothetical protein
VNRNRLLGVAFVTVASLATAGSRGTVPKKSADIYPVHGAVQDGTRIGAALMSSEEVRKVFGFDVDRSCLIVEVTKNGRCQCATFPFASQVRTRP